MSTNKKKPVSITLAAAIVICIITFILGFVISSFAFLDSRLESASEKNAELSQLISEKDAEIKELKATIEQKDENNIILAEQIQTHLETIDSLNSEVENLKDDVTTISEAAINSEGNAGSFFLSFAALTSSQQLIILVLLLVILIFIISISCSFIAAKSPSSAEKKDKKIKKEKKAKKEKKQKSAPTLPTDDAPAENAEEAPADASEATPDTNAEDEDTADEPTMPVDGKILPTVEKAIDLLYHNNLEDSISDLGGFKFGITNFDEILSDKRRPKSFGNSESGDFVAFMSTTPVSKKLYIIPRTLVLSDSTVALRGVTDLFNLVNEAGEKIDHGTVKIKQVSSPAVFACGEGGWAIESKGEIISLGTKAY